MARFLYESRFAVAVALAIAAAWAGAGALLCGCSPSIGDHCALSTDCSIQGNRVCDTSQPNGYCTLLSCTANTCPDNGACVEFGASVPGCSYNDYAAPSRVARSMCMKRCASPSDCRQSEGYDCIAIDPVQTPWTVILDTTQSSRVCMASPDARGSDSGPSFDAGHMAPVCSWSRPDGAPIDAPPTGEPTGEAGESGGADSALLESGADGMDAPADVPEADAIDGSTDSSQDAGNDAGQNDAGQDANAPMDGPGDAQTDQTLPAPDSGAVDAPAGN